MGDAVPERRVKWQKVLYKRQPFPDNYGGGSEFLKELRTNVAVVKYSWLEAACGASRVFLHENAVVAFLVIFENCKDLPVSSSYAIFGIFFAIAAVLYLIYLLSTAILLNRLNDHIYTFCTLLLFGYALTPIISTLTTTISTDTIYAMSIFLFITSFIFHDYGMSAALVSTGLSLNLSLAASVCLVSRIESCDTAFCLLAISMALFSYWPKLRNHLCQRYALAALAMGTVISPTILYFLSKISLPVSAIHLFLHFFVVFIAPWILVKMQPLKSTIHGPWDEVSPMGTNLQVSNDLNHKNFM